MMPIKRRAGKNRFVAPWGATFTETELWACVFDCGLDLLGTLELIGRVETRDLSPPLEAALDAWERLGAAYLAAETDLRRGQWALSQFGQPWDD